MITASAESAVEELTEPGLPDGWWEETPAEAGRYDRYHFDRDED